MMRVSWRVVFLANGEKRFIAQEASDGVPGGSTRSGSEREATAGIAVNAPREDGAPRHGFMSELKLAPPTKRCAKGWSCWNWAAKGNSSSLRSLGECN
jgi:hypothetical protein